MAKIYIQTLENTGEVRVTGSKKIRSYLKDTLRALEDSGISTEDAHNRIAKYIKSFFICDSKVDFFDEKFSQADMVTLATYKAHKDLFLDALTDLI
jgi:hypothetical protein